MNDTKDKREPKTGVRPTGMVCWLDTSETAAPKDREILVSDEYGDAYLFQWNYRTGRHEDDEGFSCAILYWADYPPPPNREKHTEQK